MGYKVKCPNCHKIYETELDAPPPNQRTRPIQKLFPDAEPYQREQCSRLGICSDKCWDQYLGRVYNGFIYDEKGRRFILTPLGSKRLPLLPSE